jgi:hypothetical protein
MTEIFQEIIDTALDDLEVDLIALSINNLDDTTKNFSSFFTGKILQPDSMEIVFNKDDFVQMHFSKQEKIYLYEDIINEINYQEKHITTDSNYQFVSRERICAAAIVRIMDRATCIGTLFYMFRAPRIFYASDVKKCLLYSNLVGLAIHNTVNINKKRNVSNLIHNSLIGETLGLFKILQSINTQSNSINLARYQETVQFATETTEKLHHEIRFINELLKDDPAYDFQNELYKLLALIRAE